MKIPKKLWSPRRRNKAEIPTSVEAFAAIVGMFAEQARSAYRTGLMDGTRGIATFVMKRARGQFQVEEIGFTVFKEPAFHAQDGAVLTAEECGPNDVPVMVVADLGTAGFQRVYLGVLASDGSVRPWMAKSLPVAVARDMVCNLWTRLRAESLVSERGWTILAVTLSPGSGLSYTIAFVPLSMDPPMLGYPFDEVVRTYDIDTLVPVLVIEETTTFTACFVCARKLDHAEILREYAPVEAQGTCPN